MNPSTTGMKPKTKLNPIKEEPMCIKISVFLEEWAKAKGNEDERRKIAENLWFDWFCSTKALYGKTKKFVKVIKTINKECTHADRLEFSLKNNCPCSGPLYDCFRIYNSSEIGGDFIGCLCINPGDEKPYEVMDADGNSDFFDNKDDATKRFVEVINAFKTPEEN